MKTIRTLFIFAACFFMVERFCRLQTDGFSIAKIVPESPLENQEQPPSPEILKILDQPYTFLGSGVQCYAFLSEDKKTVIKFFKHYHLFPFLESKERMKKIFKSCQIAHERLQDETGLFFLHLNRSQCAKICLIDKLGIRHFLDLSDMEFVLQKAAEPLESRCRRLPLDEVLESLKQFHLACTQKGFKNKDGKIRNYAFIGDKPVMIDIGSITIRKELSPAIVAHAQEKFEQKIDRWRLSFENSL